MPTLRELTTRLSFSADLKPLDKVSIAIEGIKSRLNLLVGIEALKSLAALTDRFGNFALDLRNAAAAAGLTTDEFQKLSYAAAQSGISQETMGSTLKSLNKRLQDARLGSEQAALAFSYAGIQPEQLGSFRNAEDALYALGKSLNAIQDPVRRAASAQEILGEQGPRLLAALSATKGGFRELAGSAQASAAVLGGKSIDALARSEQAMIALRAQAGTLAAQLGATLAPAITLAIKGLSKFIFTNQGIIRTEFRTWAKRAAFALGAVSGIVAGLAHDLMLLVRQIYMWGKTSGVFEKVAQGAKVLAQAITPLMPILMSLVKTVLLTFEQAAQSIAQIAGDLGTSVAAIVDIFRRPLDVTAWKQAFGELYNLISNLAKAPFTVITSAMQGLYNAADKLYQLFFSGTGLKDTWIGMVADHISGIASALGIPNATPYGSSATSQNQPSPAVPSMLTDATLGAMRGAAPGVQPLPPQSATPVNQTINAPVTLNISGDANSPTVLKAVQNGISDHFSMVLRQAQAGTSPGMVY